MENNEIPNRKKFGEDPGNENKHKKENQVDVDKNKTYDKDETINEDIKANNPTGLAENEEDHYTGDFGTEDEKPELP